MFDVVAEFPILALILHFDSIADRHRLEIGVPDVGRDDHAAARHFGANQFSRYLLDPGDIFHLLGDQTLAGIVHLRPDCVGRSFFNPGRTHLKASVYLSGPIRLLFVHNRNPHNRLSGGRVSTVVR